MDDPLYLLATTLWTISLSFTLDSEPKNLHFVSCIPPETALSLILLQPFMDLLSVK